MGIDLSKLTQEIVLTRTGVTFNKNNVIGKRGNLTVGNVVFETIERGGNYVSLPTGRFLLTMTKDASRGQVFIVQPDGTFGHNVPTLSGGKAGIMIHSADTPDDLTGCLAPGKSFDAANGTLLQSSSAMTDIFNFFGGFGETKLAGWIKVE
ncbi:MAG TPA: DUF5675 family protein [Pyrinomonadaceae bacterium]|nr:DUF5675 family protein [Pyrinomonadaceae bacterium]